MIEELDRRTAKRLSTTIPVDYLANHFMGNGTMTNVSGDGMEIAGNYDVIVGLRMSLRIFLPEHTQPLYVEAAAVRWVRQHQFGVEFLAMTSHARSSLNMFIESLQPPR